MAIASYFSRRSLVPPSRTPNRAIYLSSLSKPTATKLITARSNIGYAPGYLFYVDEQKALRALPFDADSGAITGDSRVIIDTVGYQPSVYWGAFAVAEDGTVIYSSTAEAAQSRPDVVRQIRQDAGAGWRARRPGESGSFSRWPPRNDGHHRLEGEQH